MCLWSWKRLLEEVLKDGCYEVRILCNPIGSEWMLLTLFIHGLNTCNEFSILLTSHKLVQNHDPPALARHSHFRKCDMVLLHPMSAKYLLLLPTSSHILKHFPCISKWLHCSIVATSQVSTNKLELVCNCKWQESLTKFQFFAKNEGGNKSVANWSQKTFKFQLGLELTSLVVCQNLISTNPPHQS